MKSIKVTVDDETYRRARIRAAERDTTVSVMVRNFLRDLAGGESNAENLKLKERALRASIKSFKASDGVSRDDIYKR